MTGRVLELSEILTEDRLACQITEKWQEWDSLRQLKKLDWEEVRRYVYATNTRQTTNASNPWKNSTTIPKLCQIRDNLFSNYTATLFPQRKWLVWEADEQDSNSKAKRDAITNYMTWAISNPMFKHEMEKIILDYIDYGNCVVTVDWIDQRQVTKDGRSKVGYVGPMPRRINPLDIVMNPTAEEFTRSPKIVRSTVSMGEMQDMLDRLSNDENRQEYEDLLAYLKEIRHQARLDGDWAQRDRQYEVEGFTSFRAYLLSDTIEVLTFYGDIYDYDKDVFLKNHVITVVDRHKLISCRPNPSYFGYPPIFHSPWRKRQDNLWGMGPLDNLVGMQYRLDHVENMRADVVDLCTYPVQLITGFVEDFVWQPGEKIFASDEGKVELVTPDVNVLQANFELSQLQQLMEEMAGAPREAMGFRSPGEKTKYEVQRLENASARIYQNKIKQFEEQIIEQVLNAMLELARRNLTGTVGIRVFNDELKFSTFQELTPEDITGIGRIKPFAARHFAEQAELVQNLTNLTGSNLWPFVQTHFSSVKMAQILEGIFNLEDYEVFQPYVFLSEQAEGQKFANALQEQVHQASATATGRGGDFDLNQGQGLGQGAPSPEQLLQAA